MGSPRGSFLCPPGFAGPSGLRAIARETSAVSEAARFLRREAAYRRRRRGTAYASPSAERALGPVVLVPGFMAGDGALSLMSRHLRSQGYRTYRSLILANVGCTMAASDALEARLESVATRRGRKVTIVGHSLGGLMARGVAGRRPDLVDGIVTLGSPVLAPGAAHPLLLLDLRLLARLQRAGLKVMGEDCTTGDCARLSWEQARVPLAPGVAFTSVFSRRDGIVDWRSCLDPQATTVEVTTSHLGMAFDPVVLDVVSRSLAATRAGSSERPERPERPERFEPAERFTRPARSAAAPQASAG